MLEPTDEELEYWANIIPCARCGEDIDFNIQEDCDNPDCSPDLEEWAWTR